MLQLDSSAHSLHVTKNLVPIELCFLDCCPGHQNGFHSDLGCSPGPQEFVPLVPLEVEIGFESRLEVAPALVPVPETPPYERRIWG